MFSCEFCEISKYTFFTEHLWATASVLITGESRLEYLLIKETHSKKISEKQNTQLHKTLKSKYEDHQSIKLTFDVYLSQQSFIRKVKVIQQDQLDKKSLYLHCFYEAEHFARC